MERKDGEEGRKEGWMDGRKDGRKEGRRGRMERKEGWMDGWMEDLVTPRQIRNYHFHSRWTYGDAEGASKNCGTEGSQKKE